MRHLIPTACLIALLAFMSPGTQAQSVWKWVDSNGVTQYTDKASVPEGVSSEEVDVPEPGAVMEDAQSTTERLKQQADKLEQERKQREQEAEAEERARALEESQQREEIYVEPKKKKKKRKSSKKPQQPLPTPKPDPKPAPPAFNQ